ncbi:hypothetical protein MNBD_NITROSPINAE03-190 [hydrothermal vent metagenome]|uniref:Uncharacterized protein n=1 Tax=hydrothermal vent metagenome TaxID=652676 RepID=A0A3B1D0U9_9ZZZZ
MEVSGSGFLSGSFGKTPGASSKISQAQRPSRTDVAVAKQGLEAQKAQGAQLIDIIQKSGSIIDVMA